MRRYVTLKDGSILKVLELTKILETLDSHAPKGVGVFSISKETTLDPQTLREYLSKYKDYFVKLPNEQSYQINRFGKFKGSVEEIIQHHEKELESTKSSSNWLLYFMFLSAFISLGASFV